VAMPPTPRFVPSEAFQTAMSLHRQGRLRDAERLYRKVLKAEPDHSGALHHLGVVHAQQGRFDDAIGLIRSALAKDPQSSEIWSDLGVTYEAAQRHAEAIPCYEKALALKPDYADAFFNLGNALQALERHAEAIVRLQNAIALRQDHAEAQNNLGKSLFALGRHQEAITHFERALASKPQYAEAEHNLGNALHTLARYGEAAAHFQRTLALKPSNAKAHNGLGCSLRQLDRIAEALRHLERAIALDPDYAEAHYNLGSLLREQGKRDDAIVHFERALGLKPEFAEARFALCMAQLPILYRDETEIAQRRSAYEEHLTRLIADFESGNVKGDLAEGLGSNLPFYLAYQGLNDRDLQSMHGALACRIMAERYPQALKSDPPDSGGRIRVGIVSAYFRHHSVWKMPIKGWLSQLDRRRFAIFGYHTSAVEDAVTQLAAGLCDRFVRGPMPVEGWREAILSDRPHILIYPEIGMDEVSARLAAQRLAPVQCATWGHPETTGMPTIDFFLSSDLMEPPDGQSHYTERLIRLPNLSIYYEPPDVAAVTMHRAELGLRADAIAFWCGQSLYKYLPQYDQVYPRIAREVGDCQFAFIEYRVGTEVTRLFRKRLTEAFACFGLNAADHCVFLGRLNQDRFVAAVGQCDIYLDSIGWSGCNSTLESLTHDLPIVTLKGDFMRGRHTAAILERMGVTDTITETVDGYVAVAARLARDIPWRHAIKRLIAENKHRVYRDRACISALEEVLSAAAQGTLNTIA
jgi:protein O-GlcNAc transferase